MTFRFGVDVLLEDPKLQKELQGKKLGLIAHPASVTSEGTHSFDALHQIQGLELVKAFGPQHGMRGEKQDNMIESEDFMDPQWKVPVISLYGKHRRLTKQMLEDVDLLLVDLQDVGCRIYTFLTTLFYALEACAEQGKTLWVLDRPNPAGRPIEGSLLQPGEESFVGHAPMPIRHGLTLGEAALYWREHFPSVNLKVIKMKGYSPSQPWPRLPWVNPSPNAASLNMARCFAGTVLLEGSHLSEGRGTTIPLEVLGAPQLPLYQALSVCKKMDPTFAQGVWLRPCYFEPTFHKFKGEICTGFQLHTDGPQYEEALFKPYRLVATFLRALHEVWPSFELYHSKPYEYELKRKPIDVINGGPKLREFTHGQLTFEEWNHEVTLDEKSWAESSQPFFLYP